MKCRKDDEYPGVFKSVQGGSQGSSQRLINNTA